MTRTTYKEQMAEAKRIEDLEMMLQGAIQRGGELLAERDRYRDVLERIANDGCGLHDYDAGRSCRDRWQNRDEWCWCCIAREALTDA